jgi:hypothetical protein
MNPPELVDEHNQPLKSRRRKFRELFGWMRTSFVGGLAFAFLLGNALPPFQSLYQLVHTPTPRLVLVESFLDEEQGLPCLNLLVQNKGDATAVISGATIRVLKEIPLQHVAIACSALPIDTLADCEFPLNVKNLAPHPISKLVREIKPDDVDRIAILLKPTDSGTGVTLAYTLQVSLTCNQESNVAIPCWMLAGPNALRALASTTKVDKAFAAYAPELLEELATREVKRDTRLTEVLEGVKKLQHPPVEPL